MTHKQIEQSREFRLWIKDIIAPALIVGVIVIKNPEVRCWIKNTWNDVTNKIKSKFQKD